MLHHTCTPLWSNIQHTSKQQRKTLPKIAVFKSLWLLPTSWIKISAKWICNWVPFTHDRVNYNPHLYLYFLNTQFIHCSARKCYQQMTWYYENLATKVTYSNWKPTNSWTACMLRLITFCANHSLTISAINLIFFTWYSDSIHTR